MKFDTIHKVRFDRGRIYYSYFNAIITALLVKVFTDTTKAWVIIASSAAVFGIVYIFGYLDDKLKIINREQKDYAERNPVMVKIQKDIEAIKNQLNK